MPYLLNTWYMAAWGSELGTERPQGRTILDQPIALFRDADGKAYAMRDRCPHRFAPLSLGTVLDGSLQCPYHGLRFDGDGQCVHNPHGNGAIPKAACVRSYPLVERHSALWIWLGDPTRADESLITDFGSMNQTDFFVGTGHMQIDGNYELETDNILDLSHIEFLHPLLGSEAIKRAKTSLDQTGNTIWSKRLTDNEILPDFLYDAFGVPHGQAVDRWLDCRWDAPSSMLLYVGVTPTGRPRSEGVETPTVHIFTPETATRTHYFFGISFPKAMGPIGAEMAAQHVEALRAPFYHEDKPMIEAQQRRIGDADFLGLKPVMLPGDAAGMRARRVLASLIEAEQMDASSC